MTTAHVISSIDALDQDVLFKMLCHVDTRSLFRLRRVCRRLRDMFEYVLGVRVRNQSVEPFAVMLVDHYMVAKTFNEEVDRQQAVIQQNYQEALSRSGQSFSYEDPDDEEILLFMRSDDEFITDEDIDDFDHHDNTARGDHHDHTAKKIKSNPAVSVN